MKKNELIEKMAKDAGISRTAAEASFNSLMEGITKAIKKKGGKITLIGFGTFKKVRRKARKGRNPQTGATINIKASNVVKFSVSKRLKAALGGGTGDTGPRKK